MTQNLIPLANPANNPLTMSSREIAVLLEKQHNHIKVSAERLAAKGVIGTPAAREFTHNGNTYTEYLLNKRDSLILVAQNSPEFTARIVDRWQELETKATQPAFQIPATLSAALRLAAEQAEQIERQQEQLAIAAPKVEFVDRYVESTGNKCFRTVAKLLGAKEPALRAFLQYRGVMYLLDGEWMAYSQHHAAGRFVVKTGSRNGHSFAQTLFTPKGVQWIAGQWAKHQLPETETLF